MKRVIGTFLAVCIIFGGLVGCSSSDEGPKYCDQEFLTALTKGLSARWDTAAKEGETEEEYYSRLVATELSKIESYASQPFEDTKLQEKAVSYINLLKDQEEALTYINVDYIKYNEMWEKAYNARSLAIVDFINEYELTFPAKYEDTVKEFMTNAKLVEKNQQLESQVQQMADTIVFELVSKSYGWADYEAVIENITDKTFETFNVDINLLDADGIILETAYAWVENFAPGKKAKLEFSTDTAFESYEIVIDYYVAE